MNTKTPQRPWQQPCRKRNKKGRRWCQQLVWAVADFNTGFSGVDEHTCITYETLWTFLIFTTLMKQEQLKAAHKETMAKLENMLENKLNLKEVQPVIIRKDIPSVSGRSVSEKHSYHPFLLITSYAEPDLNKSSSLYMPSSEDEQPNLEKEHPEKNR